MAKVWLCILAVLCGAASGAPEAACDSNTGCGGGDEAALLQHQRKSVQREDKLVAARATKKAVCFRGGGFTSVTTDAAFIVSAMLTLGDPETMQASQLLAKFDTIASVSGGSWFASSLLYSQQFNDLLGKMARDPQNAGQIFQTSYMEQWFSKAAASTGALSDFAEVLGPLSSAVGDSLYWGSYIESLGSWSAFIQKLLSTTTNGDINSTTPLGSPLPWANGKEWLACNSLVTPTPAAKWTSAARYRGGSGGATHKLSYTVVNASSELPIYVPSAFRVPFGQSTDGGGFEILTNLGSAAQLQWTAYNDVPFESSGSRTVGNFADFGSLVSDVQNLPVYRAAATSSAAAGGIIVAGALGDAAALVGDELGPRLAVWAGPRASGDPYAAVDSLLYTYDTEYGIESGYPDVSVAEKMANIGALAVIDGVYTDNTAIMHAVARGATEVLSFATWEHFSGLLSTGATTPNSFDTGEGQGQIPFLGFPIFTETRESVQAIINSSTFVKVSGEYFSISMGELTLTTRDNPLLSIPAGTSVTLRLVLGGDTLGVGAFVDLNKFSTALQNIIDQVMAWKENGDPGFDLLREFFE